MFLTSSNNGEGDFPTLKAFPPLNVEFIRVGIRERIVSRRRPSGGGGMDQLLIARGKWIESGVS